MADPVFVDEVTPLNAVNMNKLQTRDEKAAANGYPSLDGTGKVPLAQLPAIGGGADLSYDGDWVAGTYQDGDVVVKDGIAYLCVGGPTTAAPDPAPWGAAAMTSARPTYGLALPSSPADGQEHILVDSLTAATYQWRFRYNAARASNKWEFIGGAPAYVMVGAGNHEYTSSTSFVALTTAGPSVVIPVAGVYLVGVGCEADNDAGGLRMSYDIGATPATDADHVGADGLAAAMNYPNLYGERKKTLSAVTLTAKYRCTSGGTAGVRDRFMKVIPIAVGG